MLSFVWITRFQNHLPSKLNLKWPQFSTENFRAKIKQFLPTEKEIKFKSKNIRTFLPQNSICNYDLLKLLAIFVEEVLLDGEENKTCVINDPRGQTNSLARSKHCFCLKLIHSARPTVTPVANIVFCCFVFLDLKSGDGRTDNMCKNNDPYRRNCGYARWPNTETCTYKKVIRKITWHRLL